MTKIFGTHDQATLDQMQRIADDERVLATVLCADGHKGYSVPIGGVVAYYNDISPSGVGYDIACGNMAAKLDADPVEVIDKIEEIMDEIYNTISFGVGRKNKETVEHGLFDDPAWDIEAVAPLKYMAQDQLGTVGSGNHFVDLFLDAKGHSIWVGVHFGSRGLGHKIASHYIKVGGGKNGMDVAPVVFPATSDLGQEYIAAMNLAGAYAYAGREWVVGKVAEILGSNIVAYVHNHHNFAWLEYQPSLHGLAWVVRKGATPAFPGQQGFIGGSMGDLSAIVEGVDSHNSAEALYSTVHGAGRVMSRTQAAGKRKWVNGRPERVSEGAISNKMMYDWIDNFGVTLRGAGTDEAPQAYRRLPDVLVAHVGTIQVKTWLKPIGVAMAGEGEYDPFKD